MFEAVQSTVFEKALGVSTLVVALGYIAANACNTRRIVREIQQGTYIDCWGPINSNEVIKCAVINNNRKVIVDVGIHDKSTMDIVVLNGTLEYIEWYRTIHNLSVRDICICAATVNRPDVFEKYRPRESSTYSTTSVLRYGLWVGEHWQHNVTLNL